MRKHAWFWIALRRLACFCLALPTVSCAKMAAPMSDEASPAAQAAPEGESKGTYEVAIEELGAAVEKKQAAEEEFEKREEADDRAIAPPAAPMAARPKRAKAASATDGFGLRGVGAGGGGAAVGHLGVVGLGGDGPGSGRKFKEKRHEASREALLDETNKQDSRKMVVAAVTKKSVFGALGNTGTATKLFGDAGDDEGVGNGLVRGDVAREAEKVEKVDGDDKADKDMQAQAAEPEPAPIVAPPPPDQSGFASDGDACVQWPEASEPMPRRCHLAPTYHAGRASWQRRLQTLAELPKELAALDWAGRGSPTIDAPDGTALAVDARLDRDSIDGPGRVWMRIWLRSTERWGMRRPPFDLAVILGPQAIERHADETCASLQALVADVGAQDRLSLLWGGAVDPQWDGVSGIDAAARVNALCAVGLPAASERAQLVSQHQAARQLLAGHAAAEHRVAGTRVIVALASPGDERAGLHDSVSAGVEEPSLTSLLLIGPATPDADWWTLADVGHGAIETATPGQPTKAPKALWQTWSRVVARLVRVDIQLAPGVVARRVVGSRALDEQETIEVRRREQAVDSNLAKVAGVASDRKDDGVGMTMLIPAFLGSDDHAIDIELEVQGPGAVADVVVDYKDLVRMTNAKATTRAALDRLPPAISRAVARPDARIAETLQTLRQLRAVAASGDASSLEQAFMALLPPFMTSGTTRLWRTAAAEAAASAPGRARLVALIDTWMATVGGCHIAGAR